MCILIQSAFHAMQSNQVLQQHTNDEQAAIAMAVFRFASEWKISSRILSSAIARLMFHLLSIQLLNHL